jgi:hypothetical protein
MARGLPRSAFGFQADSREIPFPSGPRQQGQSKLSPPRDVTAQRARRRTMAAVRGRDDVKVANFEFMMPSSGSTLAAITQEQYPDVLLFYPLRILGARGNLLSQKGMRARIFPQACAGCGVGVCCLCRGFPLHEVDDFWKGE